MAEKIAAYRYCALVLASCIGLIASVMAVNALVDPFGMYHAAGIAGFNEYKPAIFNRVRLYKAYELKRVRAQTILLGTSRTQVGLSCSHPALVRLKQPCYNLAFDGATTREMYAYLQHAHAIRPLNHVVLGLDAYLLTTAPSETRPGFDPLVLGDAATPPWRRFVTGDLRILSSLDTLRMSFNTVTAQNEIEPSWFAADGQRLGAVFFRRPDENYVRFGPRAYFDEIDRLEIGFQSPAPDRAGGVASAASAPGESSLEYIRRIVEFCRRERIDLRIFISPSHVHQLEITAATGDWPEIENGKRALARLLAAGRPAVPLYDFSGYSSITTEPLPPQGSMREMLYYWDSSHFKSIVGDYVLDRLFEVKTTVPRDFGQRLTADSVENALAQQRVAQRAYRERNAAEVSALHALVHAQQSNRQAFLRAPLNRQGEER